MNFFRSEEHVAQWLSQRDYEPGATLSARQTCDLAHGWWGDRLDPDWVPRSRERSQAILAGLGLTGPFWELA
jgi:hypothetical protein